jgi:UPF0755 protein
MVRKALLVVLAIAAAAAAGGVLWFQINIRRPLTNPSTELVIEEGSSAAGVLRTLHEHGLLPSTAAGRLYLALRARDRSFRFGYYTIPAGSRPVDTIETILDGRVMMLSVTIPEGSLATTISGLMVEAGVGNAADWAAIIDRTDWIRDLAPDAVSLEGFLFPDTYRFAVGLAPETAARHLVDRFREVWEESSSVVAEPWGTPYEIVTLASLVEAETSVPQERSRVAGVFLNRLRIGMLLQCDPTVVYGLMRRGEWQGRLLRRHWLLDDVYNTYRYPGLPPGPINSPGRASIVATIQPETHEYLYFVARPDGGHTFSKTLKEHNRAVAVLRRAGR